MPEDACGPDSAPLQPGANSTSKDGVCELGEPHSCPSGYSCRLSRRYAQSYCCSASLPAMAEAARCPDLFEPHPGDRAKGASCQPGSCPPDYGCVDDVNGSGRQLCCKLKGSSLIGMF